MKNTKLFRKTNFNLKSSLNKHSLVCFMFLSLSLGCSNKTVQKNIEISPFTDVDLKVLDSINSKDNISFEFSGLNPLIYQYQVSIKDTIVSPGKKPALFDLLSNDKLSEYSSKLISVISGKITNPYTSASLDLDDTFRCITQSLYLVNRYFPGLMSDKIGIIKSSPLLDEIMCLHHDILYEQSQIINEVKTLSINAETAILDINVALKSWKYIDSLKINFDYKLFKGDLGRIKVKNDSILVSLTTLSSKVKMQTSIFGALETKLKDLNRKTDNDISELDSLFSFEKYTNLLAAYNNYIEFDTIKTLPFNVGANGKEVTIKISTYDSTIAAPSYDMSISIRPKNMISFGFSGGFYMSSLHDKPYSSYTIDTVHYAFGETSSSFEFGMNALAHMKVGKGNIKWHLGIGPTLAFKKSIIPGLAIGTGLAIGQQNNLAISIGCNMGFVKRKSNILNTQTSFIGEKPDFAVDVLKGGLFFSIGYNFLTL